VCRRGERIYTYQDTKQAIEYIIEMWKKVKKSTIINCWKKAGIINFRFSLTEKETDEHTKLSNIDEIKQKADFISMHEIIKSLDKYMRYLVLNFFIVSEIIYKKKYNFYLSMSEKS
jgi:hypothetical protein